MEIVKQDKFVENLSVYVQKQIFTELEVNNKIDELEKKIKQLSNASKKEKRKIKKQLHSGEKVVTQTSENNFNKKYVIKFFYNEHKKKIIINNIVEYERINKDLRLEIDFIILAYTGFQFWLYRKDFDNGYLTVVSIFMLSLFLLTCFFYCKVKNDRYKIIGNDWLEQVLLDIDNIDKIEPFLVLRTIFFFLFFLIYLHLLPYKFNLFFIGFNVISFLTSIGMFVRNIFSIPQLNFFYFIGIIILAILFGSINSTSWEGIVALVAIFSLLFSDDIWKISSEYENPLEGKYKSLNNKKKVERNVFKFKLIFSSLSLILFVFLRTLGNTKLFGNLILSEETKNSSSLIIPFLNLIYNAVDKIIFTFGLYVIFLIVRYFLLKKWPNFEKPILKKLFQVIYKGIEAPSPMVLKEKRIDEEFKDVFNPKTLIENLDDLPDDIIVSIKKPIENGNNILFIQYSDGSQTLKENVNIIIEDRNKPTRSVNGNLAESAIEISDISNKDESNTLLVQNVDDKQSLNKEIKNEKRYLRYKARLRPRFRFKN